MTAFSADLPEIAGGWTEKRITVGERIVRIALPADPDAVLDDAVTLEQNLVDDFMPYWCWLWPAAVQMAAVVDRLPIPPATRGLELGCGLGLVGTAALLAGHDIVMSDYRDEPVQAARCNAERNGFPTATARRVNWREEPNQRYDYIVACDVLYETKEHHPILDFVDAALRKNGECWIGDPGRSSVADFLPIAQSRFAVRLLNIEMEPLERPLLNDFFLLHLSRH